MHETPCSKQQEQDNIKKKRFFPLLFFFSIHLSQVGNLSHLTRVTLAVARAAQPILNSAYSTIVCPHKGMAAKAGNLQHVHIRQCMQLYPGAARTP